MSIVTKPNTFTANQIIDANQMNQNFDSIYSLANGNLDATNIAALGINDFGKLGDEVVIPSKSKGLVYGSDLYKQNWVVAGGLATFPGSPLNQISVNTVSANILQVDGSYRHVGVTGTTYTTSSLSTTYFLDLQPDGTMSWGVAHSLQAGYLPLASVTTNGSGNVLVVTDVRVLSAGISANNIGLGTVNNTILAYLANVTSDVQTQINSKSAAAGSSSITTVGTITSGVWNGSVVDVAHGGTGAATLTGILKGNGTGAFTTVTPPTGSIVGTTDTQTLTNKSISGPQINSGIIPVAQIPTAIPAPSIGNGDVTNAQLSFMNSVTSNIQTQLNAKATIASGTGSPMGVVTPTAAGQLYLDQLAGLTYVSNGVTNTSWVVETQYYGMSINSIINAAMEIWQQGTTFTNPTAGAYTADMWQLQFANTGTLPTAIVHSQVALTAGELFNAKYVYNINVNGAGSGFGTNDSYGEMQKIEFGSTKLCGNGKKVTVSFYAKSTITSKRIAVSLLQNYGTGGSPSSSDICTPTATTIRTLTSSMSLYSFTFTTNTNTGKVFGTNNDDYLGITIFEMWGAGYTTFNFGGGTAETFVGSGNISFTEVVVNAGDVALLFQPKSFAQEFFDCKRYFEKSCSYTYIVGSDGDYTKFGCGMNAFSTTILENNSPFCYTVEKRVIPLVKIYGGEGATFGQNIVRDNTVGGTINIGAAPSINYVTTVGFSSITEGGVGAVTLTVGHIYVFNYTADARL